MKQTIYQIEWKTLAQLKAIAAYLYEHGFSSNMLNSNDTMEQFIAHWYEAKYTWVVIYPHNRQIHGNSFSRPSYVTLTPNELFNQTFPKLVIVKLNDEYSATVTENNVIVGCQRFSHEAIKQLYDAVVATTKI